jgi:hypothetical protein
MLTTQGHTTYAALRLLIQTHIQTHHLTLRTVCVELMTVAGSLGLQLRDNYGRDVTHFPWAAGVVGPLRHIDAGQAQVFEAPPGWYDDGAGRPACELDRAVLHWLTDASEAGMDLRECLFVVLMLLGDVVWALAQAAGWDRAATEQFCVAVVRPGIERCLGATQAQ